MSQLPRMDIDSGDEEGSGCECATCLAANERKEAQRQQEEERSGEESGDEYE